MIRHIAAIDNQRGMAKDGKIPWRTPTDVERYKKLAFAKGNTVLMGHTTYPQVLKHLADCHAYVLTHDNAPLTDAIAIHDLGKFLDEVTTNVWIIGGASIFEQSLERADELYITEIEANFDCDQFYPPYKGSFELSEASEPVHENGLTYRFCVYRRKA